MGTMEHGTYWGGIYYDGTPVGSTAVRIGEHLFFFYCDALEYAPYEAKKFVSRENKTRFDATLLDMMRSALLTQSGSRYVLDKLALVKDIIGE